MITLKHAAERAFNYHSKKTARLNAKKRREREISQYKFKQMMARTTKDLEIVKPWISKIESSSTNFKINLHESGEREFQLKLLLALLVAGRKESQSKVSNEYLEKTLVGLYAAVAASTQFEALTRVLGFSGKTTIKILESADDFRALKEKRTSDFYSLIQRSKATEMDEQLKLELAPLYDKLAATEVRLSQLVELSETYSVAVLKDPNFASSLRIGILTGCIDILLAMVVLGASIVGLPELIGFAFVRSIFGISFSVLDIFFSVWDTKSQLKDLAEYNLTGDSILDYSSSESFGSWVNHYKNARYVYGISKFGMGLFKRFKSPQISKSLSGSAKFKWHYNSAKIAWATYNDFSFQVLDQANDGQDSSAESIVRHLLGVAKHAEEVL